MGLGSEYDQPVGDSFREREVPVDEITFTLHPNQRPEYVVDARTGREAFLLGAQMSVGGRRRREGGAAIVTLGHPTHPITLDTITFALTGQEYKNRYMLFPTDHA